MTATSATVRGCIVSTHTQPPNPSLARTITNQTDIHFRLGYLSTTPSKHSSFSTSLCHKRVALPTSTLSTSNRSSKHTKQTSTTQSCKSKNACMRTCKTVSVCYGHKLWQHLVRRLTLLWRVQGRAFHLHLAQEVLQHRHCRTQSPALLHSWVDF